jgi:hypothetical protein
MTSAEGEKFLNGMFMGMERPGQYSISDVQAESLSKTRVKVYKATNNLPRAFEVIKDSPETFVPDIIEMSFNYENPQLQASSIKELLPLVINRIDMTEVMKVFNSSPDQTKINFLKSIGPKMDVMTLQRMLISEPDNVAWAAKQVLEARGLQSYVPQNLSDLRTMEKQKKEEPEEL